MDKEPLLPLLKSKKETYSQGLAFSLERNQPESTADSKNEITKTASAVDAKPGDTTVSPLIYQKNKLFKRFKLQNPFTQTFKRRGKACACYLYITET